MSIVYLCWHTAVGSEFSQLYSYGVQSQAFLMYPLLSSLFLSTRFVVWSFKSYFLALSPGSFPLSTRGEPAQRGLFDGVSQAKRSAHWVVNRWRQRQSRSTSFNKQSQSHYSQVCLLFLTVFKSLPSYVASHCSAFCLASLDSCPSRKSGYINQRAMWKYCIAHK